MEHKETTVEDARKMNLTRAGVYLFLSRAFKVEVDETFLQTVYSTEQTIGLLSDSQAGKEMKEGSRLLSEFATRTKRLEGEDRQSLLTDLAVDYASLFLNMGVKPVYLVESAYLGKDHLLFEQPYHEVLEAYRRLGFEKPIGFPEPEDHVAVELEFMANLCKWTAQTLEKPDVPQCIAYLKLQREFLSDHLTMWVPELCERTKAAARTDFYLALAYVTRGFIDNESEILDVIVESLT